MANHLRSVPSQRSMQSPDGWTWDGANWNCGDNPTPPPCRPPCPPDSHPTPCPPWYPPPANQAPWYPGANGGVSFSATAPCNPVRGHFWWDGTTLWLYDGAAWVPVSGTSAGHGVTDGSDAAPGDIGEWLQASLIMSYAGYPSNTTNILSTMIVSPGDWDIWASLKFSEPFDIGYFILSPPPTGSSGDLATLAGSTDSAGGFDQTLTSTIIRGSYKVPSLLAFQVTVENGASTGIPPGECELIVNARRMR